MIVEHFLHTEIDKPKWDHALQQSHNSMVYANSWYLDAMCPYWEALIIGNYQYIMPLPIKSKFGIKYIYQPFLTAQLGIFSSSSISIAVVDAFFKVLPTIAKYAVYDCNYACPLPQKNCIVRQNFILNLNGITYAQIKKNYNRLATRKINKAINAGLIITEKITTTQILELCITDIILKQIDYAPHVFNDAKIMLFAAQHNATLKTIAAVDNSNNIVASIAYIIYNGRIFSLIAGNILAAKNYGAFYFVLDALLKKYANTNYTFDFEGSDIEGIAFVFKNLGGQPQPFFNYKHNNLPFPLNKIKK